MFKPYRRKAAGNEGVLHLEARPYVEGEDMTDIHYYEELKLGGMVARKPNNHSWSWYISEKDFHERLELIN